MKRNDADTTLKMTLAGWVFFGIELALYLVLPLFLGGCASDPTQGYSFNSSFDSSVRTVFVPTFQNSTYTRGIESELTEAIVKEIQRSTPWRVTGESDAQTTLSGSITDTRLRELSFGRDTGYSQELDFEITTEFSWKENRSGKVLAARKNFIAADTFTPARGVGERIESGQHGAVQKLARDIVAELRSRW